MLPNNFNWQQYVRINRDLNIVNQEDAIQHYLNYGIKEGRIYNLKNIPEDFDHISYLKCNSDIALLKLNKFECKVHYLQFGIKEGRNYNIKKLLPCDFNYKDYLQLNSDLKHLNEDQAISHLSLIHI